jgi:hypothetical protein
MGSTKLDLLQIFTYVMCSNLIVELVVHKRNHLGHDRILFVTLFIKILKGSKKQ